MVGNSILTVKIDPNYRTKAQLKQLIQNIDTLISNLMTTALTNVGNGLTAEYELDTGQTKVRKRFHNPASIRGAIQEYEQLRQLYVNRLNGSTGRYRLMNENNFK